MCRIAGAVISSLVCAATLNRLASDFRFDPLRSKLRTKTRFQPHREQACSPLHRPVS